MKTKLLFILLSLLVASCTKDDITPPDDTPKKQVDIPWPSLAKSPWPMNHGNPQSTGRSWSQGPRLHQIIATPDSSFNSQTGVAIGEDSTIYLAAWSTIRAVRADGSLKWVSSNIGSGTYTTPLITSRGSIITGTYDGYLSSVQANGILEWQYKASGQIAHTGINVGIDGTIYFLEGISGQAYLTAVNSTGNKLWQLQDSTFQNQWHATLTISPDGKTLYAMGYSSCLTAVDLNTRNVKWKFGKTKYNLNAQMYEPQQLSPAIDNDGNIYLVADAIDLNEGKPSLYCLQSNGLIKWSYIYNNPYPLMHGADPVIDYDGNIYFGLDTLYAINSSGKLIWKLGLNGYCDTPLVCDVSNTIFVTVSVGGLVSELFAINQQGSVQWRVSYSPQRDQDTSPALAFGILAVQSWLSPTLYIIK